MPICANEAQTAQPWLLDSLRALDTTCVFSSVRFALDHSYCVIGHRTANHPPFFLVVFPFSTYLALEIKLLPN